MPVSVLIAPPVPETLAGLLCTSSSNLPRYWATIWSDVLKTSLESSTRRKHLAALDRLYDAVHRQRGADCLDRLLAEPDVDALQECLVGFLAQLRNEAVVANVDKASTWTSAVSFVTDMLRFAGNSSGARAAEMEATLLRLDTLYRQLTPNPERPAPPIRALPPAVIEDLYEIFRPDSPRNPFKTEKLQCFGLLTYRNAGKSLAEEPGAIAAWVIVGLLLLILINLRL